MSKWTHLVCDGCWNKKYPGRMPARITTPRIVVCCLCMKLLKGGIVLHADPADFLCGGSHEGEDDEFGRDQQARSASR